MSDKRKASEDDTSRTKEAANRTTNNRDPVKKGLSDQDRADMKKSLEDAGYKAKDVVTE
jgi:hypothetical protein